jgi:hypothetical protein
VWSTAIRSFCTPRSAREIRDPRNVLEGHGIDVTGVEHFPQARDVGHAHRLELGAHALAPDLVELVERREELRLRRRLHRVREAAQDRAVVHDDLEVLEPERHERVVEHGKAFASAIGLVLPTVSTSHCQNSRKRPFAGGRRATRLDLVPL